MGKAIGIDLGTTYSVVAYVDADGRPTVIPSLTGKATTPSVVAVGEHETLVGDAAKERQLAGAQDVASFFKRHMAEAGYVLDYHGRDYTPVNLSALVLANLKEAAERFLGEPVRDAVITTPAYFTHVQRAATIAAGEQAGLNVLAIISEPTAAALAYGLRPGTSGQTVMVYDLGGGTFDISLVAIRERELQVIATDGDHHLGGRDWDDRVVAYLQGEFQNEFGLELVGEDFNQLLVQAENLKRSLAARESASVQVQAGGYTGTYQMTRAQLEAISRDLLERTAALTEQTLQEAHLGWTDLAGVLPVGGSTRMPMVRDYIQRMSGRPPMGGINPDEAVGLGAAIQASMLTVTSAGTPPGAASGTGRRYFLMHVRDVVAHSLGMIAESEDRTRYLNSIIVRRNIETPATETRPYVFPLRRGDPNRLEVFITQGESDNPQDCAYVGMYAVTGFSETTDKSVVVDISYAYDTNSLVHVSAVERSTGHELQVTEEPLPPDVPARFLRAPSESRGRRHATVYLAFDLSGSMSGNPLARAKQAAEAFVSNCDLSTTSVGVIEFSDCVNTSLRASQDANQIARSIQALRECSTGVGNSGQPFTEIHNLLRQGPSGQGQLAQGQQVQSGAAITTRDRPLPKMLDGARRALSGAAGAIGANEGADSARYGIVLTDGVWSHQDHAIDEAKACHSDGIEIIAIGFGSADEMFLKAVASSTEQGFFTDLGRLTEAFTTIAQELTEADSESGKRVGSGLTRLR